MMTVPTHHNYPDYYISSFDTTFDFVDQMVPKVAQDAESSSEVIATALGPGICQPSHP